MTKQSKTTGTKNSIWWCDVWKPTLVQDLMECWEEYKVGGSSWVCQTYPTPCCWMKNTVVSSKLVTALVGK